MSIALRYWAMFIAGNALAFPLGLVVWKRVIHLPFENPWGIHGPLTGLGINPFDDTLGFFVLILGGVIFNFVFSWLFSRSSTLSSRFTLAFQAEEPTERRRSEWRWTLALLVFSLFASSLTLTYHSTGQLIDGFHEGESLGPAIDLISGKVPYRDTIFLHGLVQDPYRALAAFALLGRSIAATRLFASFSHIAVALFATLFTIYYFRGRPLLATIATIVIHLAQVPWKGPFAYLILLPRDIPTIAWLWCLCAAIRLRKDILLMAVGALPFVAMVYSTDRGLYLGIVAVGVVLLFFFARGWKSARRGLAYFALGALGGFLFLRLVMGAGWKDFLAFIFGTLPRYSELLFDTAYPLRSPAAAAPVAALYLISVYRAAEAGRVFGQGKIASLRAWTATSLPRLAIWAVALVFFRSALGRSDHEHFYYGLIFAYFALFDVAASLIPLGLGKRSQSLPFLRRGILALAFLCLIVPLRRGVLADKFPIGRSDDSFLSGDAKATREYLVARLGKNDKFVTLTNEAYWYYLLDRPCPLRFSSIWLAEPPALQEHEADILAEDRSILYVLAESGTSFDAIDGYANSVRVPLIFASLAQHYREEIRIGSHVIYRRKE